MLEGVEVVLSRSIQATLQLGTARADAVTLRTKTDADGRFSFRAVPVGKPQSLVTESPALAASFGAELTPSPGEHVEVELPVLVGGRVRGRVVDPSGQAIATARVRAVGRELFGNPTAELRETESDAEGRFELAHVTPGRVRLAVRHDDYKQVLGAPFELADGQTHEQGDVVLDEGLLVAGTVSYPDGAPAAGARVRVAPDLSENFAGSPVDPSAFIGAQSDDTVDEEGAFRLAGLGPGPWIVAAELSIEADAETTEPSRAAGRWTTNQGSVRATSEGLALVLEPPVHVSGVAVDNAGNPVTSFTLTAERAGSQWYMPPSEERSLDVRSEDGRFRWSDLRSGSWAFAAQAEDYARSAEVTLDLPTEEELRIVLSRPVRLAGEVVDPDGRPVAGAEVAKELEGREVFEAMQGRGHWPSAKSDASGRFVLAGLAPGAGSVLAKKDGFAPSEPVAFELAEGDELTALRLALRHGGRIRGRVYGADGKPAAGCLVIVQMPTLSERRITNAGADGGFDERALTPGTWQVQAFPGIESLQSESGQAYDQATLIAALKMTMVKLEDEAEEHVVLGEPGEAPVRVHGRVTLDGEPVAKSMISFVPTEGGGMELLRIKETSADGRYALELDQPGDYLVTIQTTSAPGRQNSVEFRQTVPAGDEVELDFAMPLGRISGRVRGADGKPLADARVTLNIQGGLVFGTVFGGQYCETQTNADGEYEIDSLRPGRYAVAAGGAVLGGVLDERTTLGRAVRIVEVDEDQWLRGVDFRLEEPGRIRGTVRDATGAQVAGASLFVRDADGELVELFSIAQTNASGSFEYPGLAPGTYTVVARTSTQASPAGGVPARVRSGEATELVVTVGPGTVLSVSLTDASGADLALRVSVLDAGGREMNGMLGLAEIMERYSGGMTSAVQRVGPLPPGSYQVRAFAADGRSTERTVAVAGQAEETVRLRLK